MALSKTFVFAVKRHEPELVKPEESTPHEIKKLSDIDDQDCIRWLVPLLFFYPAVVGQSDPVQTIREGLAKALVFYYPFSGRMFEGPNRKLIVNCNNEGVVFVEADANVTLEQLGNRVLPPCPHMEDFLCHLPDNFGGITGSPLLYLQVTRLCCGGFVLGIRMNHPITDLYGLKLFLNATSELVRGASAPSITPVWQRELLTARSPPRITCTHNEYENTSKIAPHIGPDEINTSFFFGPKEIVALSKLLPQKFSFTKFDLLTACMWKCHTIAHEPNPDEIVRVTCVASVRATKGIQLPISYYGNAIVAPAAVSKAKNLCTRPLAYALDLVQRARNQVNEEYVRSATDFLVLNNRPDFVSKRNYIVSDHRSFGLDKLDLGWGKPLYGGVPMAKPSCGVSANYKNDKGEDVIIVTISLPPLAVKRFQNELEKMLCEPMSKL